MPPTQHFRRAPFTTRAMLSPGYEPLFGPVARWHADGVVEEARTRRRFRLLRVAREVGGISWIRCCDDDDANCACCHFTLLCFGTAESREGPEGQFLHDEGAGASLALAIGSPDLPPLGKGYPGSPRGGCKKDPFVNVCGNAASSASNTHTEPTHIPPRPPILPPTTTGGHRRHHTSHRHDDPLYNCWYVCVHR